MDKLTCPKCYGNRIIRLEGTTQVRSLFTGEVLDICRLPVWCDLCDGNGTILVGDNSDTVDQDFHCDIRITDLYMSNMLPEKGKD